MERQIFNKGTRVMTAYGPGTISYCRLSPPNYSVVEAYSVILDENKKASELPPFPSYYATIIPAAEVWQMKE